MHREELFVSAVQVPVANGAVVADPPLEQGGEVLDRNHQQLERLPHALLGIPWREVRQLAREEVLAAAHAYMRAAGENPPAYPSARVVVTGHQPELYHPGVWIKNFAVRGLARRAGAVPLHLIVDYDAIKSLSLRWPEFHLERQQAHIASTPFDNGRLGVPWEEYTVHNESLFADLPSRLGLFWPFEPVLQEFWSLVVHQRKRTAQLGERFAGARRELERQWDGASLEVPVSHLCRTRAFALLVGSIVADLPRWHGLYNQIVQEYRRRHRLRSSQHPVPDLQRQDDWFELPFWGWRRGESGRGRLFARPCEGGIALRVGQDRWPTLPWHAGAVERFLDSWQGLEREGWKVRPRALTNTLFARLFFGDLFVHGLGGGKYDELTDELIRRVHGIEPPRFMVLTGTLRLPLPAFPAAHAERKRLASLLRDLQFNPQRHLPAKTGDSAIRAVVEEKQRVMGEQPTERHHRRQRWRLLRELTARLQPAVRLEQERVRELLAVQGQLDHVNAILQRRDYAFCLYPEASLRAFLEQVSGP